MSNLVIALFIDQNDYQTRNMVSYKGEQITEEWCHQKSESLKRRYQKQASLFGLEKAVTPFGSILLYQEQRLHFQVMMETTLKHTRLTKFSKSLND